MTLGGLHDPQILHLVQGHIKADFDTDESQIINDLKAAQSHAITSNPPAMAR